MTLNKSAAALLLAVSAAFAQAPLPELRVEAADDGSVLYIKNVSTQPLTAYLIELVGYPGSYYGLWQDEVASDPIPPGDEKRMPVPNMLLGAAPDFVKLQAAIYLDGSTSGVPGRVTQFVERRRFLLKTTRELIRRLDEAQSAGTPKGEVIASLRKQLDSLPPRVKRFSKEDVENGATRSLLGDTVAGLEAKSPGEVLTALRASEAALAASKPAL